MNDSTQKQPSPVDLAAAAVRRVVAEGLAPNGTAPESCGPYEEPIRLLCEAHGEGGTDAARLAWAAIAAGYADLVAAVAGSEYVVDEFADGVTARELMSIEFPEVRWIVPGVLPEGSTLLAAKPKAGKSRLMMNVAVAVASGGRALGTIQVERGRVLYIAAEGSRTTIQKAVRKMLAGAAAPDNLHFFHEWPTGQDGADRALLFCKRHPDTRLVIFDTLKRVKTPAPKGKAMYDADYDGASPFGDLSKSLPGVGIVAIHHANKGDAATAEDPFDLVSGSTGLTAAFDTAAVLTRATVAGEAGARLYVRGRDSEEVSAALAWDNELTTWVYRGEASAVEATSERQAVRSVLEDAGQEGLQAREAVDALKAEHPGIVKGDGSNVRHLLRKMASDPLSGVRKLGRGQYAVSPFPTSEALHNVHSVHKEHSVHNVHNPEGRNGDVDTGTPVVKPPVHNANAAPGTAEGDSQAVVNAVNAVSGSEGRPRPDLF